MVCVYGAGVFDENFSKHDKTYYGVEQADSVYTHFGCVCMKKFCMLMALHKPKTFVYAFIIYMCVCCTVCFHRRRFWIFCFAWNLSLIYYRLTIYKQQQPTMPLFIVATPAFYVRMQRHAPAYLMCQLHQHKPSIECSVFTTPIQMSNHHALKLLLCVCVSVC